jgi:hypothetical protein
VWSSSVAEQFVPYMTPQHHGTHIDTRWLTLTDTPWSRVGVQA